MAAGFKLSADIFAPKVISQTEHAALKHSAIIQAPS